MSKRLEEMFDFILPALARGKNQAIRNRDFENAIEIETAGGHHAVVWLHDYNSRDLHKEIRKSNQIKNIRLESGEKTDLYTGHIFYKDYNHFLNNTSKYMKAWKNGHKASRDKESLKHYTHQVLNDAVTLKNSEKAAIVTHNNGDWLNYFQPKTSQLEEGIRLYEIKKIILDRTHICEEDRFVQNIEEKKIHKRRQLAIPTTYTQTPTIKGVVDKNKIILY